jgi:hypothetical protein
MSSFFSVGVDASGNVFPATLTAYPAAAVSGAGASITIAPQAATTTGSSGHLLVNLSPPAGATTAESYLIVQRAGSQRVSIGNSIGGGNSAGMFAGGGGAFPILTFDTSGNNVFLEGQSSVNFNIGTSTYMQVSAAGIGGWVTNIPFKFANTAITLTSNAATITATQAANPNLTVAAVTLTAAGLIDFGNVTGNFQLNIVGINAASFASFGLSLKNGTTTTALPSTALSNGGLVIVRCDPNAIAFCA